MHPLHMVHGFSYILVTAFLEYVLIAMASSIASILNGPSRPKLLVLAS